VPGVCFDPPSRVLGGFLFAGFSARSRGGEGLLRFPPALGLS